MYTSTCTGRFAVELLPRTVTWTAELSMSGIRSTRVTCAAFTCKPNSGINSMQHLYCLFPDQQDMHACMRETPVNAGYIKGSSIVQRQLLMIMVALHNTRRAYRLKPHSLPYAGRGGVKDVVRGDTVALFAQRDVGKSCRVIHPNDELVRASRPLGQCVSDIIAEFVIPACRRKGSEFQVEQSLAYWCLSCKRQR